jgi:IMP cyclohydrolase
MDSLISDGTYCQLTKVNGDDCVVSCFDYKDGTALYVVNYSRAEKANITLDFDKSDYRYTIAQRA